MNIKNRIEALEARHRERVEAEAPPQRQHCERDDTGHVIACERFVFPRDPPGVNELGVMAASFAAMKREPFSRETCAYDGCEHRARCRADGRPTGWFRGAPA